MAHITEKHLHQMARRHQRERSLRSKSPRQLEREIAESLRTPPSRRSVPGYSNYGGGVALAPMSMPRELRPKNKSRAAPATRRGHATKAAAKAGTSDKINIDQLAKLFDLPDWDRIDEMNQQHYWEVSSGAGDEEAQLDAERAAQDEVYGQWYDAVESAASNLFEQHGLELDPTGKQGTAKRRYDFKIVPSNSWNDAADKIRETINGVGTLHFDNLREFLKTGPYTARQAVLAHLGYIRRYPAVYGGLGAHQMYEQAWR